MTAAAASGAATFLRYVVAPAVGYIAKANIDTYFPSFVARKTGDVMGETAASFFSNQALQGAARTVGKGLGYYVVGPVAAQSGRSNVMKDVAGTVASVGATYLVSQAVNVTFGAPDAEGKNPAAEAPVQSKELNEDEFEVMEVSQLTESQFEMMDIEATQE